MVHCQVPILLIIHGGLCAQLLIMRFFLRSHKANLPPIQGSFDGHGQVPTKGLIAAQRFALGAIFVYQLALWYRFEQGLDLCIGLKAFLKAA